MPIRSPVILFHEADFGCLPLRQVEAILQGVNNLQTNFSVPLKMRWLLYKHQL
jgi:hypothetical protein